MRLNGLKIVVLLGLAGGFPAFAGTCYQAYENGFRNALGQNNPKQVIDDYHECLHAEESKQQREIASQEFRAQPSGHGGHRNSSQGDDTAKETKLAARPIIPPAARPYEPIPLSPSPSTGERVVAGPKVHPECVGSRYNYLDQDGSTTCPAAANNARVAVNQFRQDRDSQIRGFFNELARNDR